jgi:hypothetical protein
MRLFCLTHMRLVAPSSPRRCWAAADPKRDLEHLALRSRQLIESAQERAQQLVQTGKRQVRLALDTRGTEHPHPAVFA